MMHVFMMMSLTKKKNEICHSEVVNEMGVIEFMDQRFHCQTIIILKKHLYKI